MRARYLVIAVWSAGCVVNGKAFGPTVSSGSSSAGSTSVPAASVGTAGDDSPGGFDTPAAAPPDGANAKLPPYPDAPADPWAAVSGDQPKRWTQADADHWRVRDNESDCSARRDHCLDKDTWFVVADWELRRRRGNAPVLPAVFGTEETSKPWNAGERPPPSKDIIAYRTVPATAKNFVPGATVIGLLEGPLPASAVRMMEASWYVGTLASVDVGAGTYRMEDPFGGRDHEFPLAGARVVVLVWRSGGKVEVVGGKRRDELAVKASEVFLPRK